MIKSKLIAAAAIISMVSLLFGACTIVGTGESLLSTPTKGDINFRFLISDDVNAIIDFSSVNVTISKIGLQKDGESGNWTELTPDVTEVDLKPLDGENATEIWSGNISPGRYTKAFIYVTEVEGILIEELGGNRTEIKLPGDKLHVSKPFVISEDNTTAFVFDITVVKAGKSGQYILKPQIAESGADQKFKEIGKGTGKSNKPDKSEKPGKTGNQGEKGNSDIFIGVVDNATGTLWTVFINDEIKTVDVSNAEIKGEPGAGDQVEIEGVEENGVIIAEEVVVKNPEDED